MLSRLTALLLAVPLEAQVSPIAGSGCGAPTTTVLFTPSLGQTIQITNPFLCFLGQAIAAIGVAAPLLPWSGCQAQPCAIALQPTAVQFGTGYVTLSLAIPANPVLLGFCFRAQTGCLHAACFDVDRAVQICVQ